MYTRALGISSCLRRIATPNIIKRTVMTTDLQSRFDKLFGSIDALKPAFIERLGKAVEIPAVSGDESLRPQVVKKAHFLVDQLSTLGFTDIQLKHLGKQPPPTSIPDLQLPPVVLSRFGNDPSKKTVLVYGHYDVQPASLEDG
ncbi:hypothetical protein ZYGR_0AN01150 [Zygosaccharomyces rouxii]|uniref:Peptidase M20 dimerisation domain-containing protein n=1 Tax=Zygosaccharomyces rouxii TaxID=4956 RepID=A0A1Q3AFZ4_ZYGRO|nr:hypothetical protein ZYGR_0AN01150 [Zygosaccharomyces rouxii]